MNNDELRQKLLNIAEKLGHTINTEYETLQKTGNHRQTGHLLILNTYYEYGPDGLRGRGMCETLCKCGKRTTFPKKYIDNNVIRDCGHVKNDMKLQRELQLPPPRKKMRVDGGYANYEGTVIGFLVAKTYQLDAFGTIFWTCECACGRAREVELRHLRRSQSDKARHKGRTTTCGAHICEGLQNKGFTREQAVITLTELRIRNVSR